MDPWKFLAVVGLVLDVAGLVATLWGLDSLSGELFPGAPLPHRRVGRWLKRKFSRTRSHVIGTSAFASGGAVMNARGLVTKGRPAQDAAHEQWVAYWDSQIAALQTQVDWLNEDLRAARTEIDDRLTTETTARIAGDAELAEKVRAWLGGERGRGLALTFWGLVAAVVGTLLQGLAGLFG